MRYSEISRIKKEPLLRFLDYLMSVEKYKKAFKYTKSIESVLGYLV